MFFNSNPNSLKEVVDAGNMTYDEYLDVQLQSVRKVVKRGMEDNGTKLEKFC